MIVRVVVTTTDYFFLELTVSHCLLVCGGVGNGTLTSGGLKSPIPMADGKVEAGGKYYAITHAYYHLIFEVVEMLGPRRARVKNVRLIVSSRLHWTDFFAKGYTKSNTTSHPFPDGEVSWIDAFDWGHEIL